MFSSEKKSISGKQMNRKIRDSVTNDERDEGSEKRRKKYMEHVLETMPDSLCIYL